MKEPYVRPEVAGTVAEAIDSLSTWLAPSPVISVDPLGYLFAELRRAGYLGGRSPEQQEEAKAVTHYLMREILGYSLVDPLLRDPELEDVSCEGPGRPVKVWHKRYNSHGWLESNVLFRDQEDLNSVVARLVQRSGRSLSVSSPVVDCVLPEGYRLAATWGKEVTSLGSSFSIRKLRATPYTVSELIRAGTLDSGLAAYLWLLLEMKGFVIIAGVTASGKTTLLNAIATVLNPNWKVLSIEDTREITLPQGGWKPLHTRYAHGTSGGDVTLFDLVKLSLRERPDFVVLGESRGEEVQALFQAAATGTGCLTTFHAPNPEGLTTRLTQPPLSVAQSSLGPDRRGRLHGQGAGRAPVRPERGRARMARRRAARGPASSCARARACSARARRASGGGGRASGTPPRRSPRSWRGGPRSWTRSWGGASRTTRRSPRSSGPSTRPRL